jgi:hypothetical protein
MYATATAVLTAPDSTLLDKIIGDKKEDTFGEEQNIYDDI